MWVEACRHQSEWANLGLAYAKMCSLKIISEKLKNEKVIISGAPCSCVMVASRAVCM